MGHSEKHIAPLVLGGIIAAGASLAGNAIGASSQSATNDANVEINRQNNQFNADQAAMQRQWQTDMWNRNNRYNSPNEMISRGLNPFIGSNVGAGVSKSPASGGAAASASPSPSLQAFRPDFSDVGSALASMAQARAAMLNAEQNAALTPYKMQQILGDTDYRILVLVNLVIGMLLLVDVLHCWISLRNIRNLRTWNLPVVLLRLKSHRSCLILRLSKF